MAAQFTYWSTPVSKTNKEVAASFATHPMLSASNSSGSLFSEDGVIYSYGRHFPIARFKGITLVTTRGYSATTGKHISLVASALAQEHVTMVRCDNVLAETLDEHVKNLKLMEEHSQELSQKIDRARAEHSRAFWCDQLERHVTDMEKYRQYFGIDTHTYDIRPMYDNLSRYFVLSRVL